MRKLRIDEIPTKTPGEYRKLQKIPVLVILDNIRSLHNVGAFFRTADIFRFEKLVLCGITGCPPHRDIHKTALGATDTVAWEYEKEACDAAYKIKRQGYELISIEIAEGRTLLQDFKVEDHKKYALVFGNEVKGIQQEIIDISQACIEIPQKGTKHSLNVSVSGGIVMWEFYKQLMA